MTAFRHFAERAVVGGILSIPVVCTAAFLLTDDSIYITAMFASGFAWIGLGAEIAMHFYDQRQSDRRLREKRLEQESQTHV